MLWGRVARRVTFSTLPLHFGGLRRFFFCKKVKIRSKIMTSKSRLLRLEVSIMPGFALRHFRVQWTQSEPNSICSTSSATARIRSEIPAFTQSPLQFQDLMFRFAIGQATTSHHSQISME